MTTALLARCPAPVAPLPPRASGPTLPFSMPKTLPFSMPIDTQAGNESEPLVRQEQTPLPSKSFDPGNRLDINAAGPRELESLPGIGPVLARRIVEFRAKNPPFRRVEEILIIRGIGRRKFEALRDRIQVADSTAQPPRLPRSASTEGSR